MINKSVSKHRLVSLRFKFRIRIDKGQLSVVIGSNMTMLKGIEQLNCPICEKLYHTKVGLNSHMEEHSGSQKYFKCEVCGKEICRKNNFKKHMERHGAGALETRQLFCCDVCPKKFVSKHGLQNHLKMHYGVQEKYLCPICKKESHTSSNLEVHMETHSNSDSRPKLKCEVCHKTVLYKCTLESHENSRR